MTVVKFMAVSHSCLETIHGMAYMCAVILLDLRKASSFRGLWMVFLR